MRKEIIKDFKFQYRHRNYSLEKILRDGILRQKGYGEKYINPLASKLCSPQTRWGWTSDSTGKGSTSIVLLNDHRKEIAQLGSRGLVTTSLIFDEMLGCNRGKQDYEFERNKFFVKDVTYNFKEVHASYNIVLLDLLWYMEENNLDALEIEAHDHELQKNEMKFLSKRYSDIVNKDIKDAPKIALKLLNPLYKEMVERFKKDDGATVNWAKSNYNRDWDFAGTTLDNSPLVDTLRSYYSYRNRTDAKPVKRFSTFIKDLMAEPLSHSSDDYIGMVARHFNYVSITDEHYFTAIALHHRTRYKWKKIASSNFKRSIDWRLNEGNFIKSEVLKLRRQMEEGTFNE